MCVHAYRKPTGGLLWFCYDCRQMFIPQTTAKMEAAAIAMPPVIWDITERLWQEIRPWPLMPFKIVKRYGWYISMLHGHQYLIMPIVRNKQAVFYSARLLDKVKGAKKYDYPSGATKTCWLSNEKLLSPVFMAEGVADAAYLSLVGSSVAVLGNYYGGSLDEQLTGKRVIIALDGDAVGFTSAVRIADKIRKIASHVNVLQLPDNADPTDIELPQLKKMIKKLI